MPSEVAQHPDEVERLGSALSAAVHEAASDAAALLPGLTAQCVPEIDSTNSELMRRARAGHTAPVLLMALRQSAGRGRQGRVWVSGPGLAGPFESAACASAPPEGDQAHTAPGIAADLPSLTVSLGLSLAPQDWSGLSLVAGLALAEALHPHVGVKWPNDLWLGERKLAGILVETAGAQAGARARRYAVVGVGINLAPPAAQGLSTPPAALRELLPGIGAGQALRRLALPLVRALLQFEAEGFAPFQARYATRDVLHGRAITLSDGDAGTARGVDRAGALLVHTAAGLRAVTTAEVVSVRPVNAALTQPPLH